MFGLIYILIGYLLGSIPSAFIAGRLVRGIDIRKSGDGNVGAANAFRELGPWVGLAVMAADVLKGSAAILIARSFAPQPMIFLAGFAAVAGHIWPLYIGFKGGRGEATAAGVLSVLLPQAMLILLAIAAVPFILTRNTMILGAILFAPLWLVAWLMGASAAVISYSIGLPCVVGLTHLYSTRHLAAQVRSGGKYLR